MPTVQLREGGVWIGGSGTPAAPGRVFVSNTRPVGAAPGDAWIDPSNPTNGVQHFISAGGGVAPAWTGNSGARTFTQDSDPAASAANNVRAGDIWVRPVSATNPTAVTSVRTGNTWTVGTPSIPVSSRTFIQTTVPTGAQNGDLWINTSQTPPTKQWFWGATVAGPGGVPAAIAGTWHSDSGARTFVQDADPTTAAGGSFNPVEGDIWITVTPPVKTSVWHITPPTAVGAAATAAWLPTASASAAAPIGFVGQIANESADNHADFGTFHGSGFSAPSVLSKGIYRIYSHIAHYGWSCNDRQYRKMRVALPTEYDWNLISCSTSTRGVREFIYVGSGSNWIEFHLVMEAINAGGYYHSFPIAFDMELDPHAGASGFLDLKVAVENGDCSSWGGYVGKTRAKIIRLANLP